MADKEIEYVDELIDKAQRNLRDSESTVEYYKQTLDSLSDIRRRLMGLTLSVTRDEKQSLNNIIKEKDAEIDRLRALLLAKRIDY